MNGKFIQTVLLKPFFFFSEPHCHLHMRTESVSTSFALNVTKQSLNFFRAATLGNTYPHHVSLLCAASLRVFLGFQ